jgi:hypothetical protein
MLLFLLNPFNLPANITRKLKKSSKRLPKYYLSNFKIASKRSFQLILTALFNLLIRFQLSVCEPIHENSVCQFLRNEFRGVKPEFS